MKGSINNLSEGKLALFKEKLGLFSDSSIKISIILSIIFILITAIFSVILYQKFPPLIPFFNSMPWGEGRLASSSVIFFALIVLFLVFLINNFISLIFYNKYPLISRLMSLTAFLFIFLGFLAFLKIVLLVY